MLFLLGGNDKKTRKAEAAQTENLERVRELFLSGRFPVVTTDGVEDRRIGRVLGLVACRGLRFRRNVFRHGGPRREQGRPGHRGLSGERGLPSRRFQVFLLLRHRRAVLPRRKGRRQRQRAVAVAGVTGWNFTHAGVCDDD